MISCDIIKEEKLSYLKNVEEKLGKIWKIKWNPSTLNSNEKLYALYDVVYLSKLFRKQKKLCKQQKLKINRLEYALRIVLLYRQNLLQNYDIKKMDNIETYFGNILEIDYLRKLRTILY
jgi:ribonuclease D